jgi:hypothetical protein
LRRRAGRAHPHGPEKRLERDHDVLAHIGDIAVREIEDPKIGVREVVGQQAQPGQDRRPAPALGVDIQNLDRERVPGLGALYPDRSGERVNAVPVKPGDHACVGVRADLIVADVTRPDHDRIAGIDHQHRVVARIPGEMDVFVRQVTSARHRATSRLGDRATLRHRAVVGTFR